MAHWSVPLSMVLVLAATPPAIAIDDETHIGGPIGGGEIPTPRDDASREIAKIHPQIVEKARRAGLPIAPTATSGGRYQFPLRSQPNARGFHEHAISNHVDLDYTTGLKTYDCGTRTYDGHEGTDLFLTPYSWNAMARNEVAVVAALGGTIVDKMDGQFDQQCSLDGSGDANRVVLAQDDGLVGYYWHLKKGTVTTKPVGSRVAVGEYLGIVGSSGWSTGPHLHFELRSSSGGAVEPAHGACNTRASSWTTQAAVLDTTIVRVATHSGAPPLWNGYCDKPDPKYKDVFARGDRVFFATYMRDQPSGVTARVELVRPDGSLALTQGTGAPPSGFYQSSYWAGSYLLPADAPLGLWRVRSTLRGKRHEHVFKVGGGLPSATITAAVTGATTLTLPVGTLVTTTARITNTSTNAAVGCFASAVRPMRVVSGFRAPSGAVDQAFSVPAGGSTDISLRFTAATGFVARNATVPLFFRCTNTAGTALTSRTQLVVSSP